MRNYQLAASAACALIMSTPPKVLAQAQGSPATAPTAPPVAAPTASGVAEVAVTAARPKEQILLDRKVYSISSDLQATTGTAADVLNQIPSVDVDGSGNITLRGDPHVTILVDGKPSAQFSGSSRGASLQNFPAQDIDRIEVMTNPPVQYKAEGSAGIINIITRKSHKSGLSGTANVSVGDRRFIASAVGAYNVGKLKLSAAVTVRENHRELQDSDNETAVDPLTNALVKSQEIMDEHVVRLVPSVKIGADYDLNDRQSVGLSFSERGSSGKHDFVEQDQSGPPGGPPNTITSRQSNGHESETSQDESFRFDQKLSRPGELLSFSFQRSTYSERDHYAYDNEYISPVAEPFQDGLGVNQYYVVLEGTVDYTLPMNGGRNLKLGYDIEDDSAMLAQAGEDLDPTMGQVVNEPGITNQFHFHQQTNAAYGQYQTPLGRWTLQTGLRLEQTNVNDLLIQGDEVTDESYFRAYPSLTLGRQVGDDGNFNFSVSRRVTGPGADALNPFINYQDIYNLQEGNAKLLPQDTWSYEVGYAGKVKAVNYGLTAYYHFDRDMAVPVTEPVSGDVTLTTIENLSKSKSAGLEFSADGKLWPRLSYTLSGNLFYNQIDGEALGGGGLRDTVGLNTKASLDWRPTSADTAQISFSRTANRLTPQGYIGAVDLVNVGVRHQLSSHLAVVVTVTDLFAGQVYQRTVTTPRLQDVYGSHLSGRIAYVGLTYTFGATKKAKPSTFDYDTGVK